MRSLSLFSGAVLAVLLPIAAMAGSEPSYDVLVPYFEVELLPGGEGRTTLLAVANHSPQATEFRAAVHTNWGIEVLAYSLTLAPSAVHTANLRDWVLHGRLPDGRVLDAGELAHLQAALSGQPSPRDQRWYATEVEPGMAVGYVTFEAQGPPGHHPFWGDYYIVDSDQPLEQGETLVNLDLTVEEDLPCKTHVIRFLEVPPEVLSTELMIWTPTAAQPAAEPELADRWRVPVRIDVYDEAGRHVKRLDLRLLPVERLPVCDVCWEVPFGWMEIRTPIESAVAGHISTADADSLALHSYCVPAEKQVFEGPAIDIEKLVNGEDADSPPGPAIAPGGTVVWTYEVTNIGTEALSDIVVSDDRGVVPVCPLDALAPQESMTCAAEGTAAVCEQRNLATVTALAGDGTLVSDEDPAYYTGQHRAALAIEKRTNGEDADTSPGPSIQAGQPVAWTYVVTNSGDVTLTEVAIAYAIAATAGVALGYLASLSQFLVRVFEPLFSSIYAIPIVILFPLCILFFGIGPESKIAFGATYGFFPIVLNTIAGFGHVDDRYVRWARSMGASEPQLFRHVMLPAALPVVMSGLRIGFVITFASTIGGETLASLQGLGNRIVYFGELMRGAEMFAYIAFVIAFAFLVNALSLLLEKRGGRR